MEYHHFLILNRKYIDAIKGSIFTGELLVLGSVIGLHLEVHLVGANFLVFIG